MLREDLIVEIGQVPIRSATANADEWNYAGWMLESRDGQSSGGEDFLFSGRSRLEFDVDFDDQDRILEAFKRLREVTRVEGDAYWIKCLVVLRRDGDMRLLFEFGWKTAKPARRF